MKITLIEKGEYLSQHLECINGLYCYKISQNYYLLRAIKDIVLRRTYETLRLFKERLALRVLKKISIPAFSLPQHLS